MMSRVSCYATSHGGNHKMRRFLFGLHPYLQLFRQSGLPLNKQTKSQPDIEGHCVVRIAFDVNRAYRCFEVSGEGCLY